MRMLIAAAMGLFFSLSSGAATGAAQDSGAPANKATPADKTSPSYDMKAQAIFDLQDLQKKFVDLAGAISADKLSWRPTEGVRSFSELFLHISAANYNIPTMMGAPPNATTQQKDFEKTTTDRAKIIEQINQSFAHAISLIQGMSNGDFAKPEKSLAGTRTMETWCTSW